MKPIIIEKGKKEIIIRDEGFITKRVKRKKIGNSVKLYTEFYFIGYLPRDIVQEIERNPDKVKVALAIIKEK